VHGEPFVDAAVFETVFANTYSAVRSLVQNIYGTGVPAADGAGPGPRCTGDTSSGDFTSSSGDFTSAAGFASRRRSAEVFLLSLLAAPGSIHD
jgi:hypothetical protein